MSAPRDTASTRPRGPRYVQVIDLWSGHPAEVEKLLNHWRLTALAGEQIEQVSVRRDVDDEGHLVLSVEYPTAEAAEAPGPAAVPDAADAVALVGLLDRRPRFREVADTDVVG